MTSHLPLEINFKINFVTNFQEAVYVTGSCSKLGSWKLDQALRMEWSSGNWWNLTIEGVTDIQFDFKYFIGKYEMPTSNEIKWEQGPNRSLNLNGYTRKSVDLNDTWEYKKVIFRVFESSRTISSPPPTVSQGLNLLSKRISSPLSSPLEEETVGVRGQSLSVSSNSTQSTDDTGSPDTPNINLKERYYVTADVEVLGDLQKPQKMKKMVYLSPSTKGDLVCDQKELVYWEKSILVKASQQNLKYKYAYKNELKTHDQFERKARKINFSKSDIDYQGAYCMSDKWQLNNFSFDQITPSLFLGPYPENSVQIKQLAQKGVCALLNLQTDHDMERHCIDSKQIRELCENNGLALVHFPIADMDPEDMSLKLREAVQKLSSIIEKYKKVYVHCTSGIYRSAQVIIAYLALYEGLEIPQAIQLVEQKRPITKKNRDYIRSVYSLKGGYGKSLKVKNDNLDQLDSSKEQIIPRILSIIETSPQLEPTKLIINDSQILSIDVLASQNKKSHNLFNSPTKLANNSQNKNFSRNICAAQSSCINSSTKSCFTPSNFYSSSTTTNYFNFQALPLIMLGEDVKSILTKEREFSPTFLQQQKKNIHSLSYESYWLQQKFQQPQSLQERRRRNSTLNPYLLENFQQSSLVQRNLFA